MKLLPDLFLSFAKIGFFTFGGGYAMLPFIEDTCVTKRKWITHDDMMDITVIAESTPGPVAINCATFVGYKQAGMLGALIATLGMVTPSFIVIYLISLYFDNLLKYELVTKALGGIQIAVGLLILNAGITMIKKTKNKSPLTISLMVIACVAMLLINIFSINFSSIFLMLAAGLISLIAFSVKDKSTKTKEAKK